MRRHLLVTNDFPPKIGGIQSYLWELWRRLPAGDIAVHTTPHAGAAVFDADQAFTVTRSRESVLLPTSTVVRRVRNLAERQGAELVVWDPALPVGHAARRVGRPYAVVLHGSEVTVPGRLPVTRSILARVLRGASLVICAGNYPVAEAERAAGCALPTVVVPPGVDTDRFRPLDEAERASVRRELELPVDAPLVVSVSRLVPRKGMDTLIRAAARLGRTEPDLVPEELLPGLYGAGDVFAMLCRSRWGGLEQEGFGIVFLEAAAAGVPQVAGESGGAAEAVAHERTGLVMGRPDAVEQVTRTLSDLLDDGERRAEMGREARRRAEAEFSYDVLARRLLAGIDDATLVG